MEIYQELLSLKFTEIHKFDTWHEDVRLFVVHDTNEVCISTITKTSTILAPPLHHHHHHTALMPSPIQRVLSTSHYYFHNAQTNKYIDHTTLHISHGRLVTSLTAADSLAVLCTLGWRLQQSRHVGYRMSV